MSKTKHKIKDMAKKKKKKRSSKLDAIFLILVGSCCAIISAQFQNCPLWKFIWNILYGQFLLSSNGNIDSPTNNNYNKSQHLYSHYHFPGTILIT